MSYATSSDIAIYMPAEALLRLGSDDPGATAPDSTIIAMALEQAASLIDAALRAAGIAVPLANRQPARQPRTPTPTPSTRHVPCKTRSIQDWSNA